MTDETQENKGNAPSEKKFHVLAGFSFFHFLFLDFLENIEKKIMLCFIIHVHKDIENYYLPFNIAVHK